MGRPAKPLTNKSGVYLLKVGDAHYVGSSKDLAKRTSEHERVLKEGTHYNKDLQEAYNAYQNMMYEVLQYTDPSKEDLIAAEQRYYEDLRKHNIRLVNCGDHASSRWKGKNLPEPMKDKISKTLTGKMVGESNPFYGKVFSKGAKEKASASHRKYIVREETKDLMRQIHKGRKIDDETIAKRQASRVEGGKPYATRCDFVGRDAEGVEKMRFGSIKEFIAAGLSKGPLYKNMRTNTPYRGLYWEKEL